MIIKTWHDSCSLQFDLRPIYKWAQIPNLSKITAKNLKGDYVIDTAGILGL